MLTFILLSSMLMGQYTTKKTAPKKALKYYLKAKEYISVENLAKAEQQLQKALEEAPDFLEPTSFLGDIYFSNKDFVTAKTYYNKVIFLKPDYNIGIYLKLAQTSMQLEQYDTAIIHFEKYLTSERVSGLVRSKAERLLATARFAVEAVKDTVPFNPVNLGDSINSAEAEYLPAISADESFLIYTRRKNDKV